MIYELANAYTMLPYVILAFKFRSDELRTCVNICWLLSYYHHIFCAFNDGGKHPVLFAFDVIGQIFTNGIITFNSPAWHKAKPLFYVVYTCCGLVHVTNCVFRGGVRTSIRAVAVSYIATLTFGWMCGANNYHFNIATYLFMITGVLLKLSEYYPCVWCLGHLSVMFYTIHFCRAVGIEMN